MDFGLVEAGVVSGLAEAPELAGERWSGLWGQSH